MCSREDLAHLSRCKFPSRHRWTPSSEVFVTARPLVTKARDCVPLERHAITCDRCIGNDIKLGSPSHCSPLPDGLLMRITAISCLHPPEGTCFFSGVGYRSDTPPPEASGGSDEEGSFLLLKSSRRCTWGLFFQTLLWKSPKFVTASKRNKQKKSWCLFDL